jgi:TonB family protein
MRSLLAFLVALSAPLVSAQTSFRLVDPVLSIGGTRVATTGEPLAQAPFGVLTIGVPGDGTYTVSERPFAGARRAGQFDGDGLYFAAGGRSVRLVAREPILSLAGPTSAYVRYEPTDGPRGTGAARLTVADDPDGLGRRPAAPRRRAERVSGPRLSSPSRPETTRDGELARLRGELSRLVADRQRLAEERDRLAAERDFARRSPRTLRWTAQAAAAQRALADVTRERDRLVLERDQLAIALVRARSERERLAAEFGALRARAEAAESRAPRRGRASSEVLDLRAEVDRLRADIQARDRALDLLRAEQADRQDRMPAADAALADARRQLADALAARDRAYADRDLAYQQRDDAYLARDAAAAEADALRAERNELIEERTRLLAERPPAPLTDNDLAAERAAIARDRALLDADRAALAAEREAFEALRQSQPGTRDFNDQQALLDELVRTQTEREALLAERDRLALELNALRVDRSVPAPRPAPQTVRTPVASSDGAIAFLPGFDFGRLQNPDGVRRRLDEAEYPRWATVGRIDGDVLVLFQTDDTGRVIRTAVPEPLGGGLDGLAEEIVREMRFTPPTVDGQPTGLRSQVVVRFEL